ncbi:hypothetical protein RBSH_01349 [Rhodopirellula baltica SH28]|uniref:Uncharacterized protein n=1 Tax=Rhodopirellula baltica SH28 TaxID=993517 RepID=K5EBS2_RHOBT|nr:hypothetical protein RBSH_01349 [Rhodopirellula baltica SH28]
MLTLAAQQIESAMNVSFMSSIACSLIGSVLTIMGSSRLRRSGIPAVEGKQDA